MADCCIPGFSFPSAQEMEKRTVNDSLVWSEICAIQKAILAASSNCQPGGGQMCTTIGGTTPMTFVAGVQSIDVISPGNGYVSDHPDIRFVQPNGATVIAAAATVVTTDGRITGITIDTPGAGYRPRKATIAITSTAGINAFLIPHVDNLGAIVNVEILNAGTGYALSDVVTVTRAVPYNASYINAAIVITGVGIDGSITDVMVSSAGTGYDDSLPALEFVSTLSPGTAYPRGTGFIGRVVTGPIGEVLSVDILSAGTGYTDIFPSVTINDIGTGATATATMVTGTISAVNVITTGTNYTSLATATVYNPVTALAPNPPATPAVLKVNTSINTFGTNPLAYYNVWAGLATDKQIQLQINSVVSYFSCLGYTIKILTNPTTGSTLMWKICW